jgi:hypothetical protein
MRLDLAIVECLPAVSLAGLPASGVEGLPAFVLARHLFGWPSQRSGWIFGISDVTLIPARADFNG